MATTKSILICFSLLFCMMLGLQAQESQTEKINGYEITITQEVDRTNVQNQAYSNTCWSFATLSFLESEILRQGKTAPNFSEMFIVRNTYAQKADLYVRMHGNLNFSGGGAFHDVLTVVEKGGLVPEEAYSGKLVDANRHVHNEMDKLLKAMVDAVVENPNKKLSPQWKKAYAAVLDSYLGEFPESFSFDGKEYSPQSFAKEMGVNTEDYVELSSFTHHPYHSQFVLEVPDNWAWGMVYNLTLDEMIESIDHALENGYSVAWGGDVSEKGFSYKEGLAIVPDKTAGVMRGGGESKPFDAPGKELVITPELRQEAFDDYRTQDDHAMHITGMAKDQNGTKYYLIKNSWGTNNTCGGYLYASEAYIRYKTTALMVHKDALPKKVAKSLDIK